MHVLSIWQPWAELIVRGLKVYETRDYDTRKRGLMAIHAARKVFVPFEDDPDFVDQLEADQVDVNALAYGYVVGFARLTWTAPTIHTAVHLAPREIAYGNYAPGRFAWRFEEPLWLATPIPLRGKPWMFEWPEGEKAYVNAQRRIA